MVDKKDVMEIGECITNLVNLIFVRLKVKLGGLKYPNEELSGRESQIKMLFGFWRVAERINYEMLGSSGQTTTPRYRLVLINLV